MKMDKNRGAISNLLLLHLKKQSVGRVHSIFKNGLNVQFGDLLIFISCIGTPLSAFGLNIEKDDLNRILNSVRIGDEVVNKVDKLIFYTICEIINIYTNDLKEIDLKLHQIKCNISEIPKTKLYNYLENIKFDQLIGIPLDENTLKYINLLLNSNKEDSNMNSTIIKYFSGRGKGLTPSGDDILIGFTLALKIFKKFHCWSRNLQLDIDRNATTMISVAYLKALLNGYLSEHFIQFIKLMDEENAVVIEEVIKKVQLYGHTSGNDTLFGFLLGLNFLINNEEEYHGKCKKGFN